MKADSDGQISLAGVWTGVLACGCEIEAVRVSV
jgi:hypothetical protein